MFCPYCKSKIVRDALVCPTCTRDLRTEEAQSLIISQATQKAADELRAAKVVTPIVTGLILLLILYFATNPTRTSISEEPGSAEAVVEPNLDLAVTDAGQGRFGSYGFTWAKTGSGDIVAVFTPFLSDGETMGAAILAVIKAAFGDDIPTDTIRMQGGEVLASGAKGTYRLVLLRETTGEIKTIRISQEP